MTVPAFRKVGCRVAASLFLIILSLCTAVFLRRGAMDQQRAMSLVWFARDTKDAKYSVLTRMIQTGMDPQDTHVIMFIIEFRDKESSAKAANGASRLGFKKYSYKSPESDLWCVELYKDVQIYSVEFDQMNDLAFDLARKYHGSVASFDVATVQRLL